MLSSSKAIDKILELRQILEWWADEARWYSLGFVNGRWHIRRFKTAFRDRLEAIYSGDKPEGFGSRADAIIATYRLSRVTK